MKDHMLHGEGGPKYREKGGLKTGVQQSGKYTRLFSGVYVKRNNWAINKEHKKKNPNPPGHAKCSQGGV